MKILIILIKILGVILVLLLPAGLLTLSLGVWFSNEVAMATGGVLMGIPFILAFIELLVNCIFDIITD